MLKTGVQLNIFVENMKHFLGLFDV